MKRFFGLGWWIGCLALVGGFFLPGRGAADTLEEVHKNQKLVWGGDQEGGGPYMYPRDDNPEEVTGFEVDLAAAIGRYLKVQPEFSQGQWDKLLDLLKADKVQIVLNGYEYDRTRAEVFEASIPYYVYALQWMVRADDLSITSWEDLRKPKADGSKYKIGVLTGSACETFARDNIGDAAEIINYDGNTDSMREVETGKLDATLQDTPIAVFYHPMFPKLRMIGEAVQPGYYVIYARKGDRALIQAINEALIVLINNGELQKIYEKYGIWDKNQEKLKEIADLGKFYGLANAVEMANTAAAELKASGEEKATLTQDEIQVGKRKRGMEVVMDYTAILVESAGMTILLSMLSFPLAIIIGMLVAVGRLYGPRWIKPFLAAYVEFLRGTPIMLQLFFIFFFLPEVGINVPAFWCAIAGLAINYSAYESEIYRAGLQAIPPGQMEAALALGMSRKQALQRIVVPQAFRIVIPPVVNDFIALFKDTSVCSVITIIELTKRFSVLSQSTQATIELMLMTGALYMAMSYPMSVLSRRLEARLAKEDR